MNETSRADGFETNDENALGAADSESLHWKATVQSAPLTQNVKNTIIRTVDKTRLWKREKSAVAVELLAHFLDGIEAGATEEALLNSYGDPSDSARLIRRSKIRNRRAFWHLALWFWRSVTAVVVLYVLTAIWLDWHTSKVQTNWGKLSSLHSTPHAEPTAWPLYRAAVAQMDTNVNALDRIPGEWVPEWANFDTIRAHVLSDDARLWLVSNRTAIQLVVRASKMNEVGVIFGQQNNYGLNSPAVEWSSAGLPLGGNFAHEYASKLPHLVELNAILKILSADCKLQIVDGNGTDAFEDVQAILGLGRHLSKTFDGTFLGQCFALSYAAECIQQAIVEHPQLWTDVQLQELQRSLSTHPIDFSRLIEDSQIRFDDAIDRAYADNGFGEGFMTMHGIKLLFGSDSALQELPLDEDAWMLEHALSPLALIALPPRSEVRALFERLTEEYRDSMNRPLWETDNAEEPVEENIHDMAHAIVLPFVADHDLPLSNLPLAKGKRDGLVLGIAIERFQRQHGRWPDNLDELVPNFVSEIPVDQIHGGPLHMSLVDGRPIVYSLGIDSDDDHGHVPKQCITTRGFLYVPRAPDPTTQLDGDWVLWGKAIP